MPTTRIARAMRWAPLGTIVVVIIAVANLAPTLAAPSKPTLPPLTAQQLLVKAREAHIGAFSGVVRLTSNLGLPPLGALGERAGDWTQLLSGSHDARIWEDGPQRVRIALPGPLQETGWVRNGRDVWMWQSDGQRVTHLQLRAEAAGVAEAEESDAATPTATPDQLAQRLLATITPSTRVSVKAPEYVAGRPAYALVLGPHSATSLIGTVTAAIDAATGMATRVTITAKGDTKPAVDLKFTSLKLARPAATTFAFKPPPGATVVQGHGLGSFLAPHHRRHRWSREAVRGMRGPTAEPTNARPEHPDVVGTDWEQVAVLHGVQPDRRFADLLHAATRVTGPFGAGRLVRTKLVSVLLLDDGRLAVGSVTAAALETAVANAH